MTRSSSQELDDLVEGVVGLMVGGFDLRERRGCFRWAVLEKAVRQRSAHALMEEREHKSGTGSLVSEAIGVVVIVVSSKP